MAETLLLTVPDFGDGLVLVPADSIDAIRGGVGEDGEPHRIEHFMLDLLDPSLVSALLDANLARVEEPLGHHEILDIGEAGRAEVIALVESMGYAVQEFSGTSQPGNGRRPPKRLAAGFPPFVIAVLRHSQDKVLQLLQLPINHFHRAVRR